MLIGERGKLKMRQKTRLRGSSDRWIIYRSQFCVYLCAGEGQNGGGVPGKTVSL